MEEKILNILNSFKNNDITTDDALNLILQFVDKYTVEEEKVIEPVLVGYLNKLFHYNGCEPNPIGTPVYYFEDRYFFELKNIKTGTLSRIRFYTEDLEKCIEFISNKKE